MKTDANGYYSQKELDKLAPTIMIAKQIDEQQFDILEYHKNYSSNEKTNGKTADELFKELGYEKESENEHSIVYLRKLDYIATYIEFWINKKEIDFANANFITYDELQAINKKVEELQWN